MSNTKTTGSDRPRTDIHLCEVCGGKFIEAGERLVCLSDGRVIGGEYHVTNRRFFHARCWKNSDYMDTGSDLREEGEQ